MPNPRRRSHGNQSPHYSPAYDTSGTDGLLAEGYSLIDTINNSRSSDSSNSAVRSPAEESMNSLSGSNEGSRNSVEDLDAEIERIQRYIDRMGNNLGSIGLRQDDREMESSFDNTREADDTSNDDVRIVSVLTPVHNQGAVPRVTTYELPNVIDLCNVEYRPRLPAQRVPEAVIDLCTPETRLPVSRVGNRRRLSFQINAAASQESSGPTPPKRKCTKDSSFDEPYKCPVCLDSVRSREPMSTKCGHVFCKICIVRAITATHKCPICNKKMNLRQISRIYL